MDRHSKTVRARSELDHRPAASEQDRRRQPMPAAIRNHASSAKDARQLDRAFLRWLGEKIGNEEDALDYLIALALQRPNPPHGGCASP